jgi:hypothetical protein
VTVLPKIVPAAIVANPNLMIEFISLC